VKTKPNSHALPVSYFQSANIKATRYFAKKKQQFWSVCSILCIFFYFRPRQSEKNHNPTSRELVY
jgi:hypothetical protein